MGVTLDELLESSGISSMKGEEQDKTASAQCAQSDADDLVSALRKIASSDGDGDVQEIRVAAARELQEKTAEILIIRQTIEEIDKLASLGVPEEETAKLATFIKAALDKGHTEEDIAKFIEKQGSGAIGRSIGRAINTARRPVTRAASNIADKGVNSEYRVLRDTLKRGSPAEVQKHLAAMEGRSGKEAVTSMVSAVKDEGTRLPNEAMRYLPRVDKAKGYTVTMPGGAEKTISANTAHKGALAAGGLGTGAALRGNSGGKKGKGVTVINTGS